MTTQGDPRRCATVSTLARLQLVVAGLFFSHFLLVAELPKLANGEGGPILAGSITAAFMTTAIGSSLIAPRMLRNLPTKAVLAAGLVVIGAPCAFFSFSRSGALMLMLSGLRGVGFGLGTVATTAAISAVAGVAGRSRALGVYGLVASLAFVVAPTGGLLFSAHVGTNAVFVLAALVPLSCCAGLVHAAPIGPRTIDDRTGDVDRFRLDDRVQWRILIAFLPVCFAYGAVMSFLPLFAGHSAPSLLLGFGLGYAAARWMFGHAAHHINNDVVLMASTLITSFGVLGLISSSFSTRLVAAAVGGIGTGAIVTSSLIATLGRASRSNQARASAGWNIIFNAGVGCGGLGFGALVAGMGPRVALVTTVVLILAVSLPLTVLDHRQFVPAAVAAIGTGG